MTVDSMLRSMSEKEFLEWWKYAAYKGLPARRAEWHLAQIALVTAKSLGGAKEARFVDFLLDPPPPPTIDDTEDEDEQLEAAVIAFGFSPRRRAE